MRIVFLGTPDYVVPIAATLHKTFSIPNTQTGVVAVITQTPKPVGREKEVIFSPVDNWAHKRNIPIFYSSKKIVEENIEADLGVLASFSEFIPSSVINHFKYGIINIHPSLLPQFRGSSPIQATIITNSTPGVSFIKLDDKLDHGPILSQFKDELGQEDTSESLRTRLFERSAEVIAGLIPAYISGKVKPKEQAHEAATITREINKEDGFIDPLELQKAINGKVSKKIWHIDFIRNFTTNYSPSTIHQFIRAMGSWPGAWSLLHPSSSEQAKRLKILKAHVEELKPNNQCLVPDLVQLEGKNPVSWEQFRLGYPDLKFKK